MGKKTSAPILEFLFKHRFRLLLATLLSFVIGGPFVDEILQYEVIPDIFISIIFISGIYAISREKKHIYIAMSLMVPMFTGVWLSHIFQSFKIYVAGEIIGAIFIGYLISLLTKFIFNQKEVTKDVIYAALIIYLLMAILWSFAYLVLDYFYPASFSFPEASSPSVYRYLYFSFVTITTLGYGDVAPLTQKASSLVVLEAVTGQMYLVVVVAWLVGMHVSRKTR